MFHLRRTAFRAALSAAAKPTPASSLVVPKTRTFVSLNQSKLRPAKQWTVSSIQRRWATEGTKESTEKPSETELAKEDSSIAATESVEAAQEVVAETATESQTPAETASKETMGATPEGSLAEAAAAVPGAVAVSGAPSGTTSTPIAKGVGGLPPANNTLYVGNLFFEVGQEQLEDYFARFGQVKSTRIVYDARGLSKGFGYVEFENVDDAVRAVETANQQVFQGRRLAVQFHRPRQPINRRSSHSSNPPSKTLFIGNMSFEMSDKDLSDLFREVRNVIDVRIAIDRRSGQPRGFAHADFIDTASATKAMDFLKSKELYGRRLRVDYSLSNPVQRTPGARVPRE